MRTRWLRILACLLGFSPAQVWAGDRLKAARAEVTDSSSDLDFGDGSSSDTDGESSAIALDDDGKSPRFRPYPYAGNGRGYVVRTPESGPEAEGTKELGFHIQAEGAYLFEDVWRGSAEVRASQSRLYIQGNYDLMLEGPTPRLEGDVEVTGQVRDRLHFIALEVGGQLAPSEVITIRGAPVLSIMFDDRRSDVNEQLVVPWIGWGVSFDVFPVRPLVLRGRAFLHGSFDVMMLQLRATAGVSLNRVELYAGYDYRQVGAVRLGGPTAGVAVRF